MVGISFVYIDMAFGICTCSAKMSMFHMERRPRSTLIIYYYSAFLLYLYFHHRLRDVAPILQFSLTFKCIAFR